MIAYLIITSFAMIAIGIYALLLPIGWIWKAVTLGAVLMLLKANYECLKELL